MLGYHNNYRIWILSAIVAGAATEVVAEGEISVRHEGTLITSGDVTPSPGEGTDFGLHLQGAVRILRDFAVHSDGVDTLSIISVTSSASEFSVVDGQAPGPIEGGSSRLLRVQFEPAQVGVFTATIMITSDDADESPYTFDLRAEVVAVDLEVSCNGMVIPSGTGSTLSCTDFGSVYIHVGSASAAFEIHNRGVSEVSVDFSEDGPFSGNLAGANLAPGESATVTVAFDPEVVGMNEGLLRVTGQFSAVYEIQLRGVGTEILPPDIHVRGGGPIFNGDVTPTAAKGTDFGVHFVGSGPLTRGLSLSNQGVDLLVIQSGTSSSSQFRVRSIASSLAAGQRDIFTLVFEASEVGVHTATISIVSNDPDEGTYTFAVRGEALARPEFEIRCEGTVIPSGSGSELSCTDFGSVDVNSESVSKSFEIVNSGGVDLEVTRVGSAAPFFEDDGPSTLLPGETRVITVRFDPNSLGAISKTLEFSAVGVENSYFIELRGVGTGIAIPDASLRGQVAISSGDVTPTVAKNTDFGAHLVGSGDELRGLVLFNVGTGTLEISSVTSSSNFFRARSLGNSIAPGGRDPFTLVFSPNEVGVHTAMITIFSNDPDEGAYTFAVRGEALVRPEFEIRCEGTVIPSGSGSELSCTDFGSVDVNSESVSKSFEIVNSGEVDLEVTQVGTAAPFFEDEGPSTLLPGETRVITVRFDPNSLGAISKTLEVSAVGVENSYFIELRGVGTGIAIPDASLRGQVAISSGDVTPTVAKNTDFGAHLVGSGDELRGLVLFNVGTGTLEISSVTSSSSHFRARSLGNSIAPGGRDPFTLVFSPSEVGVHTATITIFSNDPDEGAYTFAVKGETLSLPEIEIRCEGTVIPSGTGSELTCTDFGSVDINGGMGTRTFEIYNVGGSDLDVSQVSATSPFFEDEGQSTIAPGEFRVVTVRFVPMALGPQTGMLTVGSSDPAGMYSIELRGVGSGMLPPPDIHVRAGGPIFNGDDSPTLAKGTDLGEQFVFGGPSTRGLRILNLGSQALEISSVTSSSSQFWVRSVQNIIEAGESDIVTLVFDPSEVGVTTATITILSNDPDEGVYTFTVRGEGIVDTGYEVAISNSANLRAGNAQGDPITSWGFAELGFFNTLTDAQVMASKVERLAADWWSFTLPQTPVPEPARPGEFHLVAYGGLPVAGSDFEGKEIYVMLGNGTGPGDSDEVLVFRTGAQFGDTDPDSTTRLSVVLDEDSQVVYGAVSAGDLIIPPVPTRGAVGTSRPLGLEMIRQGELPRLQWQARADRDYQVEWSADLEGSWLARVDGFLTGRDGFLTWFDDSATEDEGYYRVVERER
jgi:hypothetical protein